MLIALDIGGVCLRIHQERILGACGFRSLAEVPQELLMALAALETGICTGEELLSLLNRHAVASHTPAEWRTIWNSVIGDPLPGMNELLQAGVAAGMRFIFFSDTSPWHMEEVRRKLPAAAWIPDGIYSFEVGMQKPGKAMFEAFEKRFGKPDLYIDDREVCLNGGKAFQWRLHHFQGAEELKKLLF